MTLTLDAPLQFSSRQLEVINLHQHPHDMVLIVGPVRSGKTMAETFSLCEYMANHFSAHTALVATMSRNIWSGPIKTYVMMWAKYSGHKVRWTQDFFECTSVLGGVNKFVRVAANNSSAIDRIQGDNIACVLATEVTKMPKELLLEFSQRTALTTGAKMLYDTNPEGEQHWFLLDYIQKAEEMNALHVQFTPKDNPIMTPEAWSKLKRKFPRGSHLYARRILGQWKDATDLIWRVAEYRSKQPLPDGPCRRLDVAIDTAHSSVTHALLIGEFADRYHVIDEWRHDGESDDQVALLISTQVEEIYKRFAPWEQHFGKRIERWCVDPSSGHFRAQLLDIARRSRWPGTLYGTVNDVLEGINAVSWMLSQQMLTIDSQRCSELRREISNYKWDPEWQAKGVDKPIKIDDHGCDAMRYWVVMNSIHQTSKLSAPVMVQRAA